MGATVSVSLNEGHHRLMQAIGAAITAHTKASPMSIDEIVGILGFCAGAAIVSGCQSANNCRRMRAVAVDNIDNGMDVMRRAERSSGLILPGMH